MEHHLLLAFALLHALPPCSAFLLMSLLCAHVYSLAWVCLLAVSFVKRVRYDVFRCNISVLNDYDL